MTAAFDVVAFDFVVDLASSCDLDFGLFMNNKTKYLFVINCHTLVSGFSHCKAARSLPDIKCCGLGDNICEMTDAGLCGCVNGLDIGYKFDVGLRHPCTLNGGLVIGCESVFAVFVAATLPAFWAAAFAAALVLALMCVASFDLSSCIA